MKDKLPIHVLLGFNEKQLDKILKHFKFRKVKRGKSLLAQGEVCKELFYLHSGCLRTYFIDTDGVEKTSSVILDNYFGTAWPSFISQTASIEFMEAIENSELYSISHKDFFHLVNTDTTLKDLYLKSLELAYINQSRKIEALMTLKAKQRYQKLQKGNPSVIKKLSNKTLASFLHMREETLSRIKSGK